MADGSNPAFALAIAQAIARGQGTPQQRSAYLGQVAAQMQANAAQQQMQQQQQLSGPPQPGQSDQQQAFQQANQAATQGVQQQALQRAGAGAQQALHGQQAPPGAGGFHPHPIGPEFPGQGHPQMPLPTLPGGQLGPAEGGGLTPGQPYPGSVPAPPGYTGPVGVGNTILPTGGAGLAPTGSALGATTPNPVHPVRYIPYGGGIHQGVNPGGPMQQSPGSPLPIGRTGPVKPIGPARPPRRGTTQIGGRTYGTTTFNGHPVGF